MKERVSVTLDKKIVRMLNSLAKNRKFRNKSHVVEIAIEELNELENQRR